MEIIQKGGIVMVLIILLSLVAAVIIIERLLYFRSIRIDEERLLRQLTGTLRDGRYEQALELCQSRPTPLGSLMIVGINQRHRSPRELHELITDAANLEIPKQERFLSALGTIAHIAPLMGLLGTVTGNIRAFGVLGDLGGVSDPALLSRGISEALLTTAAGIIVSIPAIMFYNYLVNKVNHRIIRLENRVSELVSMLVAVEHGEGPAAQTGRSGAGAGAGAAASRVPPAAQAARAVRRPDGSGAAGPR